MHRWPRHFLVIALLAGGCAFVHAQDVQAKDYSAPVAEPPEAAQSAAVGRAEAAVAQVLEPQQAPQQEEVEAGQARRAGDRPYRYVQPAVGQTVRELQHASLAITLREYCADESIADEFVDARLAEFSAMTGRPEDCRSLLEY